MKKSILIIYILIFLPVLQPQTYASYCIPGVSGVNIVTYKYWIERVNIDACNSGSTGSGPGNYSNYSSSPLCTLSNCLTDTLSIYFEMENIIGLQSGITPFSFPSKLYYLAAWIDYNNDSIFSINEKLGEGQAIISDSVLFPFNVPSSTSNGLKRMRVMAGLVTGPGLDPCVMDTGEVEDYAVYINISTPSPVVSSNSPICSGSNLNLNANAGGTLYSWTGPNSFTSTLQNPVIISAVPAASGIYIATITGSPGCTASGTVSVNVGANPIPFPGSNSPVCEGKPLNFTSFNGASYLWSGPNGFTDTLQNPTIPSATPGNSGTYTVIATSAGGCSAAASTTVVVNNRPVITISSNNPVCAGHTLNLSATGGSIFYWTGPNFSSTLATPSIPSFAVNNVGNYVVRVTNGFGCTSTASVLISINNGPNTTSSYNNPVCIGTPLYLTAGGAVSYSWTGPNSFTSNIQNPSIAVTAANNSGNYIVTGTDAAGCSAASTVNVQIRSKPTANAGSNFSVCLGSNAAFHGSGGTSYSWTGPNGFISTLQNPIINAVTASAAGQYSLSVTNSFGCTSSVPDLVTLTINPLPVISLNVTGPLCVGNSITLHASGGTTYSWTGPHGFSSSSQNPVISNASLVNSGFYYATVSNGTCSAHDSINVIINPLPVITASVNSPACMGTLLQFNAASGQTFSWTGPNSFQSTLQNPAIQQAAFIDSGIYHVTVTDIYGCIDDTSVSVQVVTSPILVISNNGPVCDGNSLQLNSSGGDTYLWSGPNGFSSTLQNPAINNASLASAGIYTVTGTLAGGCSSTAQDTVIVNPNPAVSASNSSPVCAGSLLNFQASGGNIFLWADSSGFTSTLQNPFIQSTTLADSGFYMVIGTDSITGCSSVDTTYVVILETPFVSLGNDTLICQDTDTLSALNAGASYLWNDSTTNAELLVITSGMYSVTVTGSNGCLAVDSVLLTMHSPPSVSLILPSELDSVCLITEGPQLLSGGTPIDGIFSGTNVFGNNFDPDSAGTGYHLIFYTVTDTTTECSNTAVDSIFVDPCTGIEELANSGYYSLYPNPFNSSLTIENYQPKGNVKVELMTADSRLVRNWNFNGEEKYILQLGDIAAGVYFIVLKDEDRIGFFRVVKQ